MTCRQRARRARDQPQSSVAEPPANVRVPAQRVIRCGAHDSIASKHEQVSVRVRSRSGAVGHSTSAERARQNTRGKRLERGKSGEFAATVVRNNLVPISLALQIYLVAGMVYDGNKLVLIFSRHSPNSSVTGVHINQDLIWCVKIGVYMGFWVHRGS